MDFPEAIKRLRNRLFMSQTDFAKALNVSFSTVNRWEMRRSKPNFIAMKSISDYCKMNNIDYSVLQELWMNYEKENK